MNTTWNDDVWRSRIKTTGWAPIPAGTSITSPSCSNAVELSTYGQLGAAPSNLERCQLVSQDSKKLEHLRHVAARLIKLVEEISRIVENGRQGSDSLQVSVTECVEHR